MSMTSDTGPLIALAKVDLLSFLKTAFTHVLIPPSVHRELLAKSGEEAQRLHAALEDYIKVAEVTRDSLGVQQVLRRLGPGEHEAIALAVQTGTPLLVDDRLGRIVARNLGVQVIGTVGFLVETKAAGVIPAVRPVLEEIRLHGYYLSDALIDTAAALAGE